MKLDVRFLSRPKPVEWEFDGKKGKTYRLNVMLEESEQLVSLKVAEEFYLAVAENALAFGDMITINFEPRVTNTVQNGRAVQELRITPDTFSIASTAAALSAAD